MALSISALGTIEQTFGQFGQRFNDRTDNMVLRGLSGAGGHRGHIGQFFQSLYSRVSY